MMPTKNPMSIASYYCGVFGFIPFLALPLSILAVVFGSIAMNKNKANFTPGAKGHALAGIICGSIQLFILIALFVSIAFMAKR